MAALAAGGRPGLKPQEIGVGSCAIDSHATGPKGPSFKDVWFVGLKPDASTVEVYDALR
jgi:hypothetical protein